MTSPTETTAGLPPSAPAPDPLRALAPVPAPEPRSAPASAPDDRAALRIDQQPASMVPISALATGLSPRLSGHNEEHIRTLAQLSAALPPIVVHRPSMRILDGEHRVEAAKLRGDDEIAVRFFDGDDEAAFRYSVRANIAHGLPLTLGERSTAAARVLAASPEWSNRAVARATGLAPGTVGAIRRRLAAQAGPPPDSRVGRDERRRPLSTAEARRRAGQLIAENPKASLREIARETGISATTVRDVRARIAQGRSPVPDAQRERARAAHGATPSAGEDCTRARPPDVAFELLRLDPSVRSNERSRKFVKWLAPHVMDIGDGASLAGQLPPHSTMIALEIARGLAQMWTELAEELQLQLRTTAPAGRAAPPRGLPPAGGGPAGSGAGTS